MFVYDPAHRNDSFSKLLLRGDALTDGSPSGRAVSNNGGVTVAASDKHPYLSAAGERPGTGALSLPYSSDFDISSTATQWHLEFWVYSAAFGSSQTCIQICGVSGDNGYDYMGIGWTNSGKLWVIGSTTGSSMNQSITSTGTLTAGVWNHCRIIGDGSGQILFFINGSAAGFVSFSTWNLSKTGSIVLMQANWGNTNSWVSLGAGQFLGDVRFRKGVGADVTDVPISALNADAYTKLLLRMESNFTDTSGTGKSVSNSSCVNTLLCPLSKFLVFSGNNELGVTTDTSLNLGLGPFTIDLWFKCTNVNTSGKCLVGQFDSSGYGWAIDIDNGSGNAGKLAIYMTSITGAWDMVNRTSVASYTTGFWNHVALVRDETTVFVFLNGALVHSTPGYTAVMFPGYPVCIGAAYTGSWSYIFTGQIANLRISKGIARWKKNFIPPRRYY